MSNVDNENGGAWIENWKQHLLDGWIPQSLHHADKIYIVVASSIIYYIYKYKHLHQDSYKYFKTTSDINNFLSLLIQINATTEQAGQGSPQNSTIKYEKKYSSEMSHSVNY